MSEFAGVLADISAWTNANRELAPFVAFAGIGVVLGIVTLLLNYLRIPDIQFYTSKQARIRKRYQRRQHAFTRTA